jgi:hypothetical protein
LMVLTSVVVLVTGVGCDRAVLLTAGIFDSALVVRAG